MGTQIKLSEREASKLPYKKKKKAKYETKKIGNFVNGLRHYYGFLHFSASRNIGRRRTTMESWRLHFSAFRNEDQILVLNWKDDDLNRELVINFRRNLTNNFYGVERFYGNFMTKKWKVNTTDYSTTINVDSKEVTNILFHTPLDRSFSCGSWGSTKLQASNHTKPIPPTPTTLPYATVQTSMLKFDAFRNDPERKPSQPGFRNALDCEFQPNDIVPIAVGIALTVLVLVVLIAYVIGRKRNRQRGYESV